VDLKVDLNKVPMQQLVNLIESKGLQLGEIPTGRRASVEYEIEQRKVEAAALAEAPKPKKKAKKNASKKGKV